MLCKKCCPECGKGLKGLCTDCCEKKDTCSKKCKNCCGLCSEHTRNPHRKDRTRSCTCNGTCTCSSNE